MSSPEAEADGSGRWMTLLTSMWLRVPAVVGLSDGFGSSLRQVATSSSRTTSRCRPGSYRRHRVRRSSVAAYPARADRHCGRVGGRRVRRGRPPAGRGDRGSPLRAWAGGRHHGRALRHRRARRPPRSDRSRGTGRRGRGAHPCRTTGPGLAAPLAVRLPAGDAAVWPLRLRVPGPWSLAALPVIWTAAVVAVWREPLDVWRNVIFVGGYMTIAWAGGRLGARAGGAGAIGRGTGPTAGAGAGSGRRSGRPGREAPDRPRAA